MAALGWGHLTPEGVNAKLYAKTNLVKLAIWGVVVAGHRLGYGPVRASVVRGVSDGTRLQSLRAPRPQAGHPTKTSRRLAGQGQPCHLLVCHAAIARPRRPDSPRAGLHICVSMGHAGPGILHGPVSERSRLLPRLLSRRAPAERLRTRRHARRAGRFRDGVSVLSRTRLSRGAESRQTGARSCPSLLNPPKLSSNKDCRLCGQCIKACPHANMQFKESGRLALSLFCSGWSWAR